MRAILLILLWAVSSPISALDYDLQPRAIAPGTYVFEGRQEDFTPQNGGDIANTGFIITGAGVVVIDTGPSRRYGEAMIAAIKRVTQTPIVQVLNTHHHPDHFLGNQAFVGVPINALEKTRQAMLRDGPGLLDNMYRLTGDWMKETELSLPEPIVPGPHRFANHALELLSLPGHTEADMVVFDRHTGVLFTGDLVFQGRAPTTPHASIKPWLAALEQIEALTKSTDFRVLVPGHGKPAPHAQALEHTRAYLRWLDETLTRAVQAGLDMTETMALPIPNPWSGWALAREEFQRSVSHLFPALEQAFLEGRLSP